MHDPRDDSPSAAPADTASAPDTAGAVSPPEHRAELAPSPVAEPGWYTEPPGIPPVAETAEARVEPRRESIPPGEVIGVTPAAASAVPHFAAIRAELIAWFKTLFSAAVYATLIVTFGFQVARVEGESMAPTLENQDRLIVNKLAYRLGPPRRGDIVMLYYPRDPDKSFVKRVIAEEGDTVKIEDGRVFVNDVPMQDDYVLPDYRSHEDQPAQVIPAGYYFVMGDHRNNSSDSRTWGEVPKKYIVGRVQLRWWPVTHARIF
jgi:signal peptidase I